MSKRRFACAAKHVTVKAKSRTARKNDHALVRVVLPKKSPTTSTAGILQYVLRQMLE